MKLSLYLASLALAHLGRILRKLKETFGGWVPEQQPMLIPIPIPTDRSAAHQTGDMRSWSVKRIRAPRR